MDANRLESLLAATVRMSASALHLVPGRPPALRVQRRFIAGDELPVQPGDVEELIRDMLFSDHRERLDRRGHVEVLYVARGGVRYRATIAQNDVQRSLVLRPLPTRPPRLQELELPLQVEAFARMRHGLVAVGGFFGAGKSMTMAAIVARCSEDPARHIVTIEDAIEVVHDAGAALLHQREVGTHVGTAVDGIRQAVAAGADVIAIADLRDVTTLDAALSAAEAGCLVFAGVEAGSIVGVIAELTSMVAIEERQRFRARLAAVLRGATAQSLLHRSRKGGRVPVVEVLVGNPAVRQAITTGELQLLPDIMKQCRGLGMQTIDNALRGLLDRRLVTEDEALLHANNRADVCLGSRVTASHAR